MERDLIPKATSSEPLMSVASDEELMSVAPTPATLGNQDAQRNATLQSSAIPAIDDASRAVTIHFDSQIPWMISVDGTPSDDVVTTELYGLQQSVPIESYAVPEIPALGIAAARHYVIDPSLLRPEYRERYQSLVDVRKSVLDEQLQRDFQQLVIWLDLSTTYYGMIEPKALSILWKWAHEQFRPAPPRDPTKRGRSLYLDQLLLKLSNKTKDIGFLTTVWTSYYDLMFNHFSSVDELRQIRDQYSLSFMGSEAIEEVTFGGVLWDRVKSGEVRDNIFGYFKGLGDAGVGFFTGLYHLVRHPLDTLEGLIKLPGTLKTLWEHRGELWDKFANASEEDKGRIIGRFFGEIEVILATMGGAKAAGGLPKVAGELRLPTLAFAEGAVGPTMAIPKLVVGTEVVTVTADLAKYGKGAAGLSMMSQALDKTSRGADAADEMRASDNRGRSKAVEKDIAKEESVVDDAAKVPGEGEIQQVLPTARGAAVEVALMQKLGLNKLVNWFKTLDGIEGGTYRLVKEATRFVHEYINPKGYSVKSTKLTDFKRIEDYVHAAVTDLKNFTTDTRTESGVTVRVRGLKSRQLEFVFDAEAQFANEEKLVGLMKRLTKNAKARGVDLRWWVDKGGDLWEGFKYYADEAKLWGEVSD